jgi:hypothetical protein
MIRGHITLLETKFKKFIQHFQNTCENQVFQDRDKPPPPFFFFFFFMGRGQNMNK